MFVGSWKYGTERPLAAGQHFQSYAARDRDSGKPVFLKVEHDPDRFGDASFARAHLRLWKSVAPISIEGVPRILDYGRKEGRVFLITEWIEGEPLRSLLRHADPAGFPPDFLDRIFADCSRILDGIHARGLLHGDISPGNIMMGEDRRVHLIDLAPADAFMQGHRRTIVGTPAYMSPSLKAGANRTPADDFFALKKVIADAADMLGGRVPPTANGGPLAEAAARWRKYTRGLSTPANAASADWEGGTQATHPGEKAHQDARRSQARSNWVKPTAKETIPLPKSHSPETVRADFVVFAPEHVRAGQHFFVELWAGPAGSAHALIRDTTCGDRMVERGGRRHIDLVRDLLLTVVLKLPGFEVMDPVETLGWNGDTSSVGFIVKAPDRLGPGPCPGVIKLIQDQIPFATITFDLEVARDECASTENGPRDSRVRRIEQAFASYATQDRAEVLRRVQGMTATGTEVFVDVVSQRAGTAWQETLHRKIEESDGLFLFWSRHAAASAWVEMEWRHALAHHGIDFIHPVALEDPRDVAPPPELAGKHFNDMLLPFIFMEDSRRRNPDRDGDRRDFPVGR